MQRAASASVGVRQKLSSGWGMVQAMAGAGDLTGDGLPDLTVVWNDGTAHLYPGKAGGLAVRGGREWAAPDSVDRTRGHVDRENATSTGPAEAATFTLSSATTRGRPGVGPG
ncbi:hypothetical protein C3492_13880 [Streptomyces sp. Ru62]|nr:hypothetical protein C3492_13880 [Streptomyces sp. Ru62]